MHDSSRQSREISRIGDVADTWNLRPAPPLDAAELRARADRRYPISSRLSRLVDIVRRRPAGRWLVIPAAAMSVLLVLGAIQMVGQPTAPMNVASPPPCLAPPCVAPLAIEILAAGARGSDARTGLRALADRALQSPDVGRAGPATFIHIQEYTVDPANRTAPGVARDDKLLWYPDGSARQVERAIRVPARASYDPAAALAQAGPERTEDLGPGGLGLPEIKPSDSFQLLAAELDGRLPAGGSAAMRTLGAVGIVVDLYRHYALTPGERHAVLMMLSDFALQSYGEIESRDGSRGVAFGVDDEAGRQRSVLIFDESTGYLKGHEEMLLPAPGDAAAGALVSSFVVLIEAAQRQ